MATFPSKVNYATGDILTATNMNDVGGAINLLESAQFAAGKNKIINGDFGVWQRGTSFTPASGSNVYTADRFFASRDGSGATVTISQQTFTPGTAPVAGYEGQYFLRYAQTVAGTGGTYNNLTQRVEDVRTFAGQTITISFWAKASATAQMSANWSQYFGVGGSSAVYSSSSNVTLTTSWQRFTYTMAVTSISGKTIGTSSAFEFNFTFPVNTAQTIDIWGAQVEAASTASNFQTATGTKQGELAACQRYYWRTSNPGAYAAYGVGAATSTTSALIEVKLPVTMRTAPSSVDYANIAVWDTVTITATTSFGINASGTSADFALLAGGVAAGLTVYRPYFAINNNTTAGYIGLSAEL